MDKILSNVRSGEWRWALAHILLGAGLVVIGVLLVCSNIQAFERDARDMCGLGDSNFVIADTLDGDIDTTTELFSTDVLIARCFTDYELIVKAFTADSNFHTYEGDSVGLKVVLNTSYDRQNWEKVHSLVIDSPYVEFKYNLYAVPDADSNETFTMYGPWWQLVAYVWNTHGDAHANDTLTLRARIKAELSGVDYGTR